MSRSTYSTPPGEGEYKLVSENPHAHNVIDAADIITTALRDAQITYSAVGGFAAYVCEARGGLLWQVDLWVDASPRQLLPLLEARLAVLEVKQQPQHYYIVRVRPPYIANLDHDDYRNMIRDVQVNLRLALPRMLYDMQPDLIMPSGYPGASEQHYAVFRPAVLFASLLFDCHDFGREIDYETMLEFFDHHYRVIRQEIVKYTDLAAFLIGVKAKGPESLRDRLEGMMRRIERAPEWFPLIHSLTGVTGYSPASLERIGNANVS